MPHKLHVAVKVIDLVENGRERGKAVREIKKGRE